MKKISKNFEISTYVENENEEPLLFEKCYVSHLSIGSSIKKLEDKKTFKDIVINKCKIGSGYIGPVDLKNITIHGLTSTKRIDVCNALFENCTFKGKIGSIMIIDFADLIDDADLNKEILRYNNEAYKQMDWALDISDADFTLFECRSVPAEKIIINHENQIAVNYVKLNSITEHPDEFKFMSEMLLDDMKLTRYNFVMATCKRTKRHKQELEYFNYIRDIGCEL